MVNVFYSFNDETSVRDILYPPIKKLDYPINVHTKRCPALHSNNDWFVIKSPYTYHLKHSFSPTEESLINILDKNSFSGDIFNKLIFIHPKWQRNDPKIPTIQLLLEYVFHTKENNVEIEVFPAFMNHELNKQPLVSVHGKFPISDWLRPIQFSFDWINPKKEILIPRGTDLMYIRFNKKVNLSRADFTEELRNKVKSCGNMTAHFSSSNINDWKWLFKHAKLVLKL